MTADRDRDSMIDEIQRLQSERAELVARAERLTELAQNVTTAFTAEAEDWNDGEYALWRKDDLLTAIYALRAEVGVRS